MLIRSRQAVKSTLSDWPLEKRSCSAAIQTFRECPEGLFHRSQIFVHLLMGVSERRLKLAASQISFFQHDLREKCRQHEFLLMLKSEMAKTRQATGVQLQPNPPSGRLPALHDSAADGDQVFRHVMPPKFADGRQGCNRTDAFGPVGTADECRLGSLHDLFRSDNRRHRVAVSYCFGKNRDVGTYIQEEVNTSIG